jgi:hypothetical protein
MNSTKRDWKSDAEAQREKSEGWGLRACGPQEAKLSGRDTRVEDMTTTVAGPQKIEHGPGWHPRALL